MLSIIYNARSNIIFLSVRDTVGNNIFRLKV